MEVATVAAGPPATQHKHFNLESPPRAHRTCPRSASSASCTSPRRTWLRKSRAEKVEQRWWSGVFCRKWVQLQCSLADYKGLSVCRPRMATTQPGQHSNWPTSAQVPALTAPPGAHCMTSRQWRLHCRCQRGSPLRAASVCMQGRVQPAVSTAPCAHTACAGWQRSGEQADKFPVLFGFRRGTLADVHLLPVHASPCKPWGAHGML